MRPAVLAAALVLAANAPAQTPEPAPISRTGTEAFRAVLSQAGFRPVRTMNQFRAAPPRSSVAVILGRTDELTNLAGYLNEGGTLLLATDSAGASQALWWFRAKGLFAQPGYVECPDDSKCYRGNHRSPFVVPTGVAARSRLAELAKPFAGLTRVATNNSASFSLRGDDLLPVALFPRGTHLADAPNRRVGPGSNSCCAAGRIFTGDDGVETSRVLVLSDHSVLINEMLLQTDNDNLDLAFNLADWLKAGSADRPVFAFIEDGELQPDFDLRLQETPLPLPPLNVLANALMQQGNKVLAKLEDRDALNQRVTGNVSQADWSRRVWTLLTLALLGYGVRRLWASRGLGEKLGKSPPLPGPAAPPASPDPIRVAEALATPERFAQGAAAWLRLGFAALGAGADAEGRPTPFWVRGGFWERRRLRRAVQRLWGLSRGGPGDLRPKHLAALRRDWERLRDAARDGRWGFASGVKEVS